MRYRILKIIILFFISYSLLFSQTEKITLVFGGDCTFSNSFEKPTGNDFQKTFANIPWFKEADISMVNLESQITRRGTKVDKEYNFRMNPKYLEVLKNAGIDVVNIANNHIVDYGLVGFEDTIYYLDSMNIKHCGAGNTLSEARKPAIIEIKGKKFGFLGYYSGYPASEDKYGTVPRKSEIIKEDIRFLKEDLKIDYVIVNFHWGEEGSTESSPMQEYMAHLTIDAGADIIIGHHPHVLQEFEVYKGKYICYSLGNFIFGGNPRKYHQTIIFKLIIENNKLNYELIPIEVKNFSAFDVNSKKREKILKDIKYISSD